MRSRLKWIGLILLWGFVGTCGLIVLVLGGLSTDAGNDFIRKEALKAADPSFPNGKLDIGVMDTNLLGYVSVSP